MGKFQDRLLKLIYGDTDRLIREGRKLEVANLRRMLGSCPICGQDFTGHYYASFALTPLPKENKQQVDEFLKALREHRWADAKKFRDFEPLDDAIGAQALRCAGRQIMWLAMLYPYEPGADQSIIEQGILDHEESRLLEDLIERDGWVALQA